jgi:hypothetical protein
VVEQFTPTAPQEALMASVTPWASLDESQRRHHLTETEWATKIRKYDREGPGIVGAALDLPAATSTLLNLVIQERTPAGWETINDPYLNTILGLFQGDCMTQGDLVKQMIRTLDAVGAGYLITHTDNAGRWWYSIVQTTNVRDTRDGYVEIRTRPMAREGTGGYLRIEDRYVHYFHTADPEWADMPWSPMCRALPHIEQYRCADRNITRNLDSQLAMNGILWAEATAQGSDWPARAKAWAHKAKTQEGGVEQVAPFMMSTKSEPKWLDIGRGNHADQIEVVNMALMGIARATDIPNKWLTEGPGSEKFANSYFQDDFYADYTMRPRWSRVVGVITEAFFQPWVRTLGSSRGYNPENLRVWADDSALRSKTDNSAQQIDLMKCGVATREAAAEAAGLRPDQVLELPAGVSEAEWLLAITGRSLPRPDIEEDPTGFEPAAGGPTPPLRAELEITVGSDPTEAEARRWASLTP